MELLRPILELGVVIPGMLLAYFPAKSSLKQPLSKLVLWLVPLLALLCAAGGVVCYARRMPTVPMLAGLTLLAVVIYIKTLRISLWKSGTIALSVCAVFACINSLSRAINAAMLAGLPQAQAAPWFCLRSAICYCSYVKGSALAVTIMFLPATSGVLPFPDFAEASEEVLYHQRSFPLRLVEPAQALPVCLSRTQLPFFQRSVCGHRR